MPARSEIGSGHPSLPGARLHPHARRSGLALTGSAICTALRVVHPGITEFERRVCEEKGSRWDTSLLRSIWRKEVQARQRRGSINSSLFRSSHASQQLRRWNRPI
jgi:hypothetical protein